VDVSGPLQHIQEQSSNPDPPPSGSKLPTSVPAQASNRSPVVSPDMTGQMSDQIQTAVTDNEELCTDSKIRMVDIRRKNVNILSLQDVNQVPGDFILTYDRTRNKWWAKPKAQFTQFDCKFFLFLSLPRTTLTRCSVTRGTLCRLPRGIGSNYRVPSGPGTIGGFFRPWRQLTFPKNMKRMFGHSVLTMFVESRRTTAELQADLNP
jgi:hypothetical protein